MQKPALESCPENWDKMKIGIYSRFCENCQKEVMDFTEKSREEILMYLLENSGREVCGRLHRSQIDFSHTDILVIINALSPKQKQSNLPFYLLAIGSLVIASCTPNSENNSSVLEPKPVAVVIAKEIPNVEKSEKAPALQATNHKSRELNISNEPPPPILEVIETGIIAFELDTQKIPIIDTPHVEKEPFIVVDVMPEFVGGIFSLTQYLKQNTQYPEWERNQMIEGKVIVQFVVDKYGKIRNPKILKSVPESKNFDKEVLRVIENMPDWKPGKLNGKEVDVFMTAPVKFQL